MQVEDEVQRSQYESWEVDGHGIGEPLEGRMLYAYSTLKNRIAYMTHMWANSQYPVASRLSVNIASKHCFDSRLVAAH